MYICVTHVDSKTKIPGYIKPMRNGPTFPDLKGLNIEFWNQSCWPILNPQEYPLFFGTCDDDADTTIPGVVRVLTEQLYNASKKTEELARIPTSVSPTQLRLALLKAGLLQNVMDAIELLPEETKTAVKIELEFALEISRYSRLMELLSEQLSWSEEQVWELFKTASNLSLNDFAPKLENTEE